MFTVRKEFNLVTSAARQGLLESGQELTMTEVILANRLADFGD